MAANRSESLFSEGFNMAVNGGRNYTQLQGKLSFRIFLCFPDDEHSPPHPTDLFLFIQYLDRGLMLNCYMQLHLQ